MEGNNRIMRKRLVCILLALTLCGSQVLSVSAAREEEIQAEKEENARKLSDANQKIDDLEYRKQQILSAVDELDQRLVRVLAQIDLLKEQITGKETEIEGTHTRLGEAEEAEQKQYKAMKKRIQYIYEKGGQTAWMLSILEAGDLSDFLNKAEYTEKLYGYDRKSLEEYAETIRQVKELSEKLTAEKVELEVMKNEQELQKASLETSLDEKKAAADDYETQLEAVQAQASQYKVLIEEQNQELRRLEEARKKEAEKQAQEAARSQAAENSRSSTEEQSSGPKVMDSGTNSNKESGPVLNEPDSSAGPESTDTSENTEISDTDTSPDTKEHNTSESGRISGEDVVNYALQFVGRRYVWGGESLTDGVDCSGFTMKVYEHFGISLPHYTGDQEQCGRGVSYAEAQPGDLILYSGHVAIYMGGGQIVHAANSQPYPKGGIKVSDNAAYMPIVAVRRLIG